MNAKDFFPGSMYTLGRASWISSSCVFFGLLTSFNSSTLLSQSLTKAVVSAGSSASINKTTVCYGTVGQSIVGLVEHPKAHIQQGFWVSTSNSFFTDTTRSSIRVSPHPVLSEATIHIDKPSINTVSLQLHTLLGEHVAEVYSGPWVETVAIDIRKLGIPDGIYLLHYQDGAESNSLAIIVHKKLALTLA